MKKNQYCNRTSRKPALSSMGLAVMATLIAGGAQGAGTDFSFIGESAVVNATGHRAQSLLLDNIGSVRATLQNGQGNIGANGQQTANSAFLTGNVMGASAIGNVAQPVDTSIDLALISDTSGGNPGLASLLYATNVGVVSSLAEDNALSIGLVDFANGSAANRNNTISANTVVNQGMSSIAGTVPNGYASVTPGSTSVSSIFSPAQSVATGSIVVTTAQQTSDAGASAIASNNAVTLSLTANVLAGALEAGAAVTGNKIVSSTKGNSSASNIDIQGGDGAPAFAGSAVVSNTQLARNATSAATNSGGTVSATVTGSNGISETGGSLAVSGNSISSASIGNEALGSGTSPVGNRIMLADGLSFAGPGGSLSAPGALLNGHADGTAVNADLAIVNTQSQAGQAGVSAVSSSTSDGAVRTTVDSLVRGAVVLSANDISSSATGNAASSALSNGANAASFSGTVALANQQDKSNVGVSAVNANSFIEATAADVQNSSVSVAGNRSGSSARGNEVGQSLKLNATTLALGTTVDLNSQASLLQASGAATVGNRQVNTGAPVTSDNINSSIGQRAAAVTGPTLSVTGNTQDAVALSNNASNQLVLTGTTVGSGAGILSQQRVDPEDFRPASPVTATLSGARAFIEAGIGGGGVTGSTLALTDNRQEAIGYGNLVNNAMAVSGTTLAVPATLGAASTVGFGDFNETVPSGNVVAAYGVLSQQSVQSDVIARATSGGASNRIAVTGSLDNSAALNDANTLSTEAFGNFAQSGLTINATNLATGGFSSVANLTSLQAVDAAIQAQAAPGAVALTTIGGNVGSSDTASSVSASGNRINAQASGSRVTNTVGVSATNIDTAALSTLGTSAAGALTTNASFSLQNVQSGQASVTASLRNAADTSLPSDVRVDIGGNLARSSVIADGNTARASATSNNAVNTLALDASGDLASSSAQQNVQITSARVTSLVGAAGTPATAGVAAGIYNAGANAESTAGSFDYNVMNKRLEAVSEPVVFSTARAGQDKAALESYLSSLGFVVDTQENTATVPVGRTVDLSTLRSVSYGETDGIATFSFGGFSTSGMAATAATPNLGGVNLAVGGAITDSALSVSGNTTYGLTRGNVAANSTTVTGNRIASGSGATVASTGAGFMDGGLQTAADHTLSNLQAVAGENAIDSNVHGSFFIKAQPGAAISGSSLSVSGNTQMAEARANIATSSLMLDGTSVSAVSALQSVQQTTSAVTAASNLNLFAPGAMTDSSVLLSNNSNIGLAVMNDATNSLVVKGSQAGTQQAGTIGVGGMFGETLSAEHVLGNQQTAGAAVSSTVNTSLNNQETVPAGTRGADRSTLSILDNTTAAEATANQAINTASVSGTASQAASVALRNVQDSGAAVSATATSAARVSLAPLASTALNSSSVALDGNSTTALARGNTASNVLNSLAGSAYGAASSGSVQSGDALSGFTVSANAGILNSQSNSGTVSAASTGASYQVALNSGMGSTAVGSSMGVTGNQVAAQAYGNSAVNQLTLNALNTGSPASAVGSYQRNTGAITAAVTSVSFGTGIASQMMGSGPTGSTVNVSGNQTTASAVGNSVASSIMASPR